MSQSRMPSVSVCATARWNFLYFEILITLWAISMAIGLTLDKGYDPDNQQVDDGTCQALQMDATKPVTSQPTKPTKEPSSRKNI
ncbi:MAG: hypothetical protein FJX89_05920 [Bacteroidetes bacterium]|nr:hypothetical protein [Bacteroidota bacterium]